MGALAVGASPFLGNLPLQGWKLLAELLLVHQHKTFRFQQKVWLPSPGIPAMTGTPALEQGTATMARALLGLASCLEGRVQGCTGLLLIKLEAAGDAPGPSPSLGRKTGMVV